MTFAVGTKVRYKSQSTSLSNLNGIEGTVVKDRGMNTTIIKVTKGTDAGTHHHIIGNDEGFSTSNLVEVKERKEFKVGDRVKVNEPGSSTHHGLVGTVREVGLLFAGGTVRADVDESCEAFQKLKEWNTLLTGTDWYLRAATLELLEKEKPKVGGAISYEQVERGQKIEVSYESKGVVHSRKGIVGTVVNNKNAYNAKDNWTINALDDEAERFGDKGQRLNWGSDKKKETIVLLEAAPEVDAVLERLLESKGGTVIRAFHNPEFLVREPFSDGWKNHTNKAVYTSEFVRSNAGDEIVFFVEDMEGH